MSTTIAECKGDYMTCLVKCQIHGNEYGNVESCMNHQGKVDTSICVECCKLKQAGIRQIQAENEYRDEMIASQKKSCSPDTYMICPVKCQIHGEGSGKYADPCDVHFMIRGGAKCAVCFECCKLKQAGIRQIQAENRYRDEMITLQKKSCRPDTYMTCQIKCQIHVAKIGKNF